MTLEFSHITIAAELVTLEEAKRNLGVTDAYHDAQVADTLRTAQDLVIAQLGVGADATWTGATVPRPVWSAIQVATEMLYEKTYEEPARYDATVRAVSYLLSLYRDPTAS